MTRSLRIWILLGGLMPLLLVGLIGCSQEEPAAPAPQPQPRQESTPAAAPVKPVAGDVIKVGVAGPHTGDLAPYGIPTKEAVELFAAELNAKGGLLGKPVELLVMDDQCKPEIATNVATNLVSQGAQVVIGHICSGATKAAMGIYKQAGVIAISPAATNPPLTKSGEYPNFFRTIAPDDMQGKLAAAFALDKLGARKIAVLHDKGDYGKGFADFAKLAIEEDGRAQIVLYEGVTPGAMDYSAVVQKVRRDGADAVIFGGYHPEASKLISQLKKKRVDVPFIGPDGVKGVGFLEIAGADAEGVYATGPMDVSKHPLNRQAHQAYVEKFGKEPGTFFDQGVAAWQAAVNAIKTAGKPDAEALAAALRNSPVETAVGTIQFDANGDAEGVGFSVYQVRDGAFVELQ